jgi:hypothetical protein
VIRPVTLTTAFPPHQDERTLTINGVPHAYFDNVLWPGGRDASQSARDRFADRPLAPGPADWGERLIEREFGGFQPPAAFPA